MDENKYFVTPSILYTIINYAVEHPEKHFCADELTDDDDNFLSCFFIEDDQDGHPIWELDGADALEKENDELKKRIKNIRSHLFLAINV